MEPVLQQENQVEQPTAVQESFTKLLMKNRKFRRNLVEMLSEQDRAKLSCCSKKLNKVLRVEQVSQSVTEGNKVQMFNNMIRKFIKKAEKKPDADSHYVKGNLFDLSIEALEKFSWILLNPTEENNNQLMKDLPSLFPGKLLKDYSWYIYHSEELKKFIAVHRSLVDPTLEFFFKVNQRKRDEAENEQEGTQDAKIIEEAMTEFSIEKFKGLNNGMAIRHKLLTEKMNELQQEQQKQKDKQEITELFKAIQAKLMTFVLCEGGSFSVGVFDREKEVTHHSDHKYVVRKKQGGRQITKDKGKSISSVGSQIRRANEVKHQENIEEILGTIKDHLAASDYVFIQAPGDNTTILFDEGKALFEFKKKQNFKSLCLTAKKANYSEIKSIREHILKVYIISEEPIMSFV